MPKSHPQSNTFDIFDVVTYGTVAAGYLLSIIAAHHPAWLGFAVLTGLTLAWLVVYHRLVCSPLGQRRGLMLALIALASATMLTTHLGLNFDWLIAFVTVGVVASLLPLTDVMWGGGVLLGIVLAILAALDGGMTSSFLRDMASMVPGYLFVAGFSHMMRRQATQREEAEALAREAAAARAALEVAHAQLQAYAASIEELTVTRERNRMAREIHDTLGHYLTILALQLETATKLEERGDPRLHAELLEARRVATECLAEVRHSVAALRPADPTARSLAAALHHLVAESEASAPTTTITLDVDDAAQDLPTEVRLTLYRAAQEALTNVRKHARATKVLLRLRAGPNAAELSVLDNGIGAAASADGHEPGFGLVGMRERVALLSGTATSQPVAGQGWRVDVVIPLHRASQPPSAAPIVPALAEE